LKCGGVQTCHGMDTWWLNVIRAVLISGCVRNMDAHGINVSKSLANWCARSSLIGDCCEIER
jgi:hypothetical protein